MSRILDGMVTESGILSAFCNICQRFKSETGSLSGTVEVTYVSLKSVYSIQDRWDCPKPYIHTLSSSSIMMVPATIIYPNFRQLSTVNQWILNHSSNKFLSNNVLFDVPELSKAKHVGKGYSYH